MNSDDLTNEELVEQIKSGINAMDGMSKLWQQNIKFVYKMANQYHGYAETEDLLQEGFLGMYAAVFKYDQKKNNKFLTYAEYWIKTRMQRFITQKNCVIRIPDGRRQQIRQYLKVFSEYEKHMGRKPKKSEMARIMGMSIDEIEELKQDAKCINISSLDIPVGEDEDMTIGQLIPGCDGIEDDIIDNDNTEKLKNVLWEMVDNLPGMQSQIIHSVYQNEKTRKETADDFGMLESTVRREERSALMTLRNPKNSSVLNIYRNNYVPGRCEHIGVQQFNRTWTSSVEREILRKH